MPKRKSRETDGDIAPLGAQPIRSILIVGGGSAGWMAAAALSNAFRDGPRIILVESDEIGTVGVGEATIPAIKLFNQQLKLDEAEFIRATGGSFKLGIEFAHWGRVGDRYFHPFGRYGRDFDMVPLANYWIKLRVEGRAPPLDDLCLAWAMASRGRFAPPSSGSSGSKMGTTFSYAYHFDAGLYAQLLRRYSEERGVVRHEGRIVDVSKAAGNGHVRSVTLADGRELEADLFIDCSGFRGLLIDDAMQSPFEDWSRWLPCDRALAVATARPGGPMTPFTRSTAHSAGWQWRIPLQHRTGNGHVFASALMSEEEAARILLEHADTEALGEPRLIKFKTGRRSQPWIGNVVALGLAAGFLEPLESTSIHLVQSSIGRLVRFFPDRNFDPLLSGEFNRLAREEWEDVRDFIILHYHATERRDSELWKQCASTAPPDTLQRTLDAFRSTGRFFLSSEGLFKEPSWLAVCIGQGVEPRECHPLALARPHVKVDEQLARQARIIANIAERIPQHEKFIARYCRSPFAT